MKLLKILFLVLTLFIVLTVAISFLLPREVELFRATEINAPVEQIYPILIDLHQFNRWSPWFERDPEAEFTFSGNETGVGSKMSWRSDNPEVGSGTQEITAITHNSEVRIHLDFGDQGEADAHYLLEPTVNGGTRITWGFRTDLGENPLARYFGLMFDRWIGPDYERGLANLKAMIEKG